MKTGVTSTNCWELFKRSVPQSFSKATYGFIPQSPLISVVLHLGILLILYSTPGSPDLKYTLCLRTLGRWNLHSNSDCQGTTHGVDIFWNHQMTRQAKGFEQKGHILLFWADFHFFRIKLIFGRLIYFDMKSIIPRLLLFLLICYLFLRSNICRKLSFPRVCFGDL